MGHLFSIFAYHIFSRASLSQQATCHILSGRKEPTSLFEVAVGLQHVEDTFSWQLQEKGAAEGMCQEKRWLQQRSWGGQRKGRTDTKKRKIFVFLKKRDFLGKKDIFPRVGKMRERDETKGGGSIKKERREEMRCFRTEKERETRLRGLRLVFFLA